MNKLSSTAFLGSPSEKTMRGIFEAFAISSDGRLVDLRGPGDAVAVRQSDHLRWVPTFDGAWSAAEALMGQKLIEIGGPVVPPSRIGA